MKTRQNQILKVLIAEDHAVTATGLEVLLKFQENVVVVGRRSDGVSALEGISSLDPDVLVLDLGLPGLSGIEILKQLRQHPKSPRVVVFSGQGSAFEFDQALKEGADALLSKSDDPQVIVEAILRADGLPPFMSETVAALINPLRTSTLTKREKEVLTLVAKGMSSIDIAAELSISSQTVKKHRENLMRKLGVSSAVDATRVAFQLGLSTSG